jgi:hypothetical protein
MLWRANGVLLGVDAPLELAGQHAMLRFDWRTKTLRARIRGADGAADVLLSFDVAALVADSRAGYKRRRATGEWLQRGPLCGGTNWLPPNAKLGVKPLLEALRARPLLMLEQYTDIEMAEWRSAQRGVFGHDNSIDSIGACCSPSAVTEIGMPTNVQQ